MNLIIIVRFRKTISEPALIPSVPVSVSLLLPPFAPPCVQGKQRMRHDFAGVVERMERLRAPLEYAWGVMSHLTGVKNSDPLRDAHQELQVSRTVLLGCFCLVLGVAEKESPRVWVA